MNVKNCGKSKILNNFTMLNNLFETLTVELLLGNYKVILTSIYHPPSSGHANNIDFAELFTLHLRQLLELKIPLILAGDLNLNLLNPNNFIDTDLYINNLFELSLKPLVTIPTKGNLDNPITYFSILDQIWISEGLQSERTFVLPIDITDHFPVCTIIVSPFFQQCRMGSNKIRPLSARGRELFSTLLSSIQVITTNDNADDTYEAYFEKVLESYNVAFPIINRSDKQKQPSPWITYRLKQCIKKKAKLYRLFLKGRTSRVDNTTYKNRLTNVLRR